VIRVRIRIADDGDTLAGIADRYRIELEQLRMLNPQIIDPYVTIAGMQVTMPASDMPRKKSYDDICLCPMPILPTYLDQWVPLTPIEEMARQPYDILIVGTGAGGGAVLWRLIEQLKDTNIKIGVIEAGDLLLPTNALNIPTLNALRFEELWRNPKFWNVVGRAQPDHSNDTCPLSPIPLAFQQLLTLGGRTIFWNAVSPRMHRMDIEKWPISYTEMNRYYNAAEKLMNVSTFYSKGSLQTQVLLEQLQRNGFPEADDMPIAADLSPTQYGEIHSNVFFSSLQLVAKALNQRPFDLAVKSRAVQVLVENGRAAGVKVVSSEHQTYNLTAPIVVVAASTFGTPRILLNSGIEGRAIGHYLSGHSRVVADALLSRLAIPEKQGTLSILVPRTETRPYQIQMYGPGAYFAYHNAVKPLREEWTVNFQVSGAVESRYDNYVALDPLRRDEYGMPELQIHFSYNEKDMAIIRQMSAGVKRAAIAMGGLLLPQPTGSETCLRIPGEELHEMGTCRMGEHPDTAATNRYGEVFGVSGLFIADNSVIPTSGAANPTLTTVALALRTADYIAERLQ
jgi:choline dehydrogenase-like flavoprotein